MRSFWIFLENLKDLDFCTNQMNWMTRWETIFEGKNVAVLKNSKNYYNLCFL